MQERGLRGGAVGQETRVIHGVWAEVLADTHVDEGQDLTYL